MAVLSAVGHYVYRNAAAAAAFSAFEAASMTADLIPNLTALMPPPVPGELHVAIEEIGVRTGVRVLKPATHASTGVASAPSVGGATPSSRTYPAVLSVTPRSRPCPSPPYPRPSSVVPTLGAAPPYPFGGTTGQDHWTDVRFTALPQWVISTLIDLAMRCDGQVVAVVSSP